MTVVVLLWIRRSTKVNNLAAANKSQYSNTNYRSWFKHILLSNIYTIGFNTSFTTYMKFSPDNVVVNRYILSDCRSDPWFCWWYSYVYRYILSDCRSDPWFWIVGDTRMFIGIYCRIADQIHGFRLLVILVCLSIYIVGLLIRSMVLDCWWYLYVYRYILSDCRSDPWF